MVNSRSLAVQPLFGLSSHLNEQHVWLNGVNSRLNENGGVPRCVELKQFVNILNDRLGEHFDGSYTRSCVTRNKGTQQKVTALNRILILTCMYRIISHHFFLTTDKTYICVSSSSPAHWPHCCYKQLNLICLVRKGKPVNNTSVIINYKVKTACQLLRSSTCPSAMGKPHGQLFQALLG